MSAQGILCAGRIYCDLVFSGLEDPPEPGREVYAERLTLCAGGGAYITAAYLGALGREVTLMGHLPAAPFDRIVTGEMAQNRVGSACTGAAAGDPQITVALVQGCDRAFVTRRVGAAVDLAGPLVPARHLHIGELATALECPDLIRAARKAGMSVSLDCSWDAEALASGRSAEVIGAVDLFLPNEAEMEALTSHGITPAPRKLTVVKQGSAGATALDGAGQSISAPGQSAEVRDTTGAGDAFNAGFLVAWLEGAPVAEALALANQCGATAVTRMGGAGALPDLSGFLAAPLQEQARS